MQDDVVCCKITQKKDINGLCYENIKNNIYICTPKITIIYIHELTKIIFYLSIRSYCNSSMCML